MSRIPKKLDNLSPPKKRRLVLSDSEEEDMVQQAFQDNLQCADPIIDNRLPMTMPEFLTLNPFFTLQDNIVICRQKLIF